MKMSGRASAVSILVMISLTRAISDSASAMRFFSGPFFARLPHRGGLMWSGGTNSERRWVLRLPTVVLRN